jgi:light-regulated signal transduction histidine kinase (bacteriophytochrome)
MNTNTTGPLEHRHGVWKHFMGALVHDLDAPLRGIESLADDLQWRCREFAASEVQEDIRLILDSARRVQRLISDVLEYLRLGHHASTGHPVCCSQVLAQALANLHAETKESRAMVTSSALPTVTGNAAQLAQVFQNLVGNALKFRGVQPPRVHVAAVRTDEGWEFSVRDNGIGMASEDLDKIFDPFRRLHSQDVFPGTGVGLPICRMIVERHGGRMWAESEMGRGSILHFTLPDTPARHAATDHHRTEKPEGVREK